MKRHDVADQNFYITANMVLKLAAKTRELFESSEVEEKTTTSEFCVSEPAFRQKKHCL